MVVKFFSKPIVLVVVFALSVGGFVWWLKAPHFETIEGTVVSKSSTVQEVRATRRSRSSMTKYVVVVQVSKSETIEVKVNSDEFANCFKGNVFVQDEYGDVVCEAR